MGTVYAFFADGFEEIEAFTAIDTLRRAGLNVEIVSVTPDEIVVGAHDVSVLCDINFENCDFFDAELLLLPGGMPGAATLDKHEGLRKLILDFAAKGKNGNLYQGFDIAFRDEAEFRQFLKDYEGTVFKGNWDNQIVL